VEKLKPLLAPKRRSDGRGRPWRDTQAVLNGVLWVLRTGAPWHDLPDRYPPIKLPSPLQQWQRDGTLDRLLHALAEDLRTRANWICRRPSSTQLQFGEKRACCRPTRRGKGSKIMAIADRHGLLSPAASPALRRMKRNSSKPLSPALHASQTKTNDRRPAYDSDRFDQRLRQKHGIRLIAPQVQPPRKSTQDCRELPGYCRRWKIERLFAWLTISADRQPLGISRGQFSRNAPARCLIILLRHL